MLELILGGARSGKSRRAEEVAGESAQKGTEIIYIATAQANDQEMLERIQLHQQRRPAHWRTIESPVFLAETICQYNNSSKHLILVDCLTLWLSNLLSQPQSELFTQQREDLLKAITSSQAHIILVSNETGLGVVPMGELTRRFVDESGFLHQQIAHLADRVTFMIAGLPHRLKNNT